MTITTSIVDYTGFYSFTLLWSCDNRANKNAQSHNKKVTVTKRLDGNQFQQHVFKNSDEVSKLINNGAKVLLLQVLSINSSNRKLECATRHVSTLISRISNSRNAFEERSESEWEFKVGPGISVDFYSIGFEVPGLSVDNLAFIQVSGGTKISAICNIPMQLKVTLKNNPPNSLKPFSFIHRAVNGVIPLNAIRLSLGFFFAIARTSYGDIPCKTQGNYAWYTLRGEEYRTNHFYFIVPSSGYSANLVETNQEGFVPEGAIKLNNKDSNSSSQYVCVVHIGDEGGYQGGRRMHIPGRTDSHYAWCGHEGREICSTDFSYLVVSADKSYESDS